MKALAPLLGLISAGLWFWSAATAIPAKSWDDLKKLEGKLKRSARINGAAALASGLAVLATVFSN
ncbi:hypothetical protein MPC4_10316 [Methylocella tundrae]|uniref:Uncharacterized protein n=1 Tax=Methylocella tundrae TaxID=227605 RepID=A0A8B6M0M3_METTU|nr:hypothetical protein MPC1_3030002 [Methylocella tundrae]VTZ48366.1 hypothetical protein MPC4_10316 [Methylocella tundrae]